MPKKNTSIIARRPQWSPRRPAGSDARPNSANAPAAYGIRSSQRETPKSVAIAPTAVANIEQHQVVDRVRDVEQDRDRAGVARVRDVRDGSGAGRVGRWRRGRHAAAGAGRPSHFTRGPAGSEGGWGCRARAGERNIGRNSGRDSDARPPPAWTSAACRVPSAGTTATEPPRGNRPCSPVCRNSFPGSRSPSRSPPRRWPRRPRRPR